MSVSQRVPWIDQVWLSQNARGERASLAGFEPATRCLEGSRSIQLSYRDSKVSDQKCSTAYWSVAKSVPRPEPVPDESAVQEASSLRQAQDERVSTSYPHCK